MDRVWWICLAVFWVGYCIGIFVCLRYFDAMENAHISRKVDRGLARYAAIDTNFMDIVRLNNIEDSFYRFLDCYIKYRNRYEKTLRILIMLGRNYKHMK